MKKIYAIAALSLLVGSPLLALESEQKAVQEVRVRTGKARIVELRSEYSQGVYQSLFDSLEAAYQEILQTNRLEEFAQLRFAQDADEQLKELANQFTKMASLLLEQRNSELRALCKEHEQEVAAKRVLSMTEPMDAQQMNAMRTLSFLRFKMPHQAVDQDERTLIEIDLAYEFKSVHLNLNEADEKDLLEMQIVLGMDKMRAMEEASKSFTNQELKEAVSLAAKGFDAMQAKGLDTRNLLAELKKPATELDRNISSVLSGYQAKKDDLYQREFLSKLQS